MSDVLFYKNSNVLELQGLYNNVTGVPDTGATVTIIIYDSKGETVGGQSWPAVMVHTENGTYRITLNSNLEILPNKKYYAEILATGIDGEAGRWYSPIVSINRSDW